MAMFGLSRPPSGARVSVAALLLLAGAPALARAGQPITVTAATLDQALQQLSRQTGTEIVSTEPGLAGVRVRPFAARLAPAEALARLLEGTGYRAERAGSGFRVIRAPAMVAKPVSALRRRPTAEHTALAADVVITASKQRVRLTRFPATVTVLDAASDRTASAPALDTNGIVRAAPVLQTTQLGPGRNKLFVRGIADSSFNGATQSTASVYFGEVQLSYSGADPDLKLVDVARVEIMEGPQGTLYGAGSIGGVVRITPSPVDLSHWAGSISAGVSAVQGGSPGYDASGVLNVPLGHDASGARLVAYRSHEGGYISDTLRQRNNINQTDTVGGRLALRSEPGHGWSVEGGLLGQRIDSADAQYGDGAGAMTRRSPLAQPFRGSVLLGRLVIAKHWGSGLQLLSATGAAWNDSSEAFDASRSPATLSIYRNTLSNLLVTQETRLSRSLANGSSWVVGFALLRDRNEQSRELGTPGDPSEIIGVTNISRSASVFGEGTLALTRRLSATLGVRGTIARAEADPSVKPRGGGFFTGQKTQRFDPTVALTYVLAPGLSAYARYQSGYRTGGLAVARGVGRVAEFTPDTIDMGEFGLRMLHGGAHPLTLTFAASHANWRNIQADLFTRAGQPFTTNIGDAKISTLEATAAWRPLAGLDLDAAALYTSNQVTGPLADTSVRNNRRLAQTPAFAARGAIDYSWRAGSDAVLRAGAGANYVGRAVLGTGDYLDVSHPRYIVADAHLGWTRRGWSASLTADNLFNSHADRFPFGNPFTLAARTQTTPLRPRTVRLGTAFSW